MTYKADRRDKERRLEREFVEFPFKDANGSGIVCDPKKSR
jgi:hypothetical protein